MSDIFQLPINDGAPRSDNPFERFGLSENPFPASGLESGVFYTQHMTDELKQINAWIKEVGQSSQEADNRPTPFHPLAIFGSLGVGKTHLLHTLEQGLGQDAQTPTLRKGLADEGMTRLVLADLFLRYLPFTEDADEPGSGLLFKLVQEARSDPTRRQRMKSALRDGSPVGVPFFAVVDAGNDEAIVWLSRWLRREYTTPAQRSKLRVSDVLQSEGEAIRVMADLMRLARAAGVLKVWFVMIDQLEELWRHKVITPTRRARFLTDLRHLIDEALQGAPIAVLMAWNTTVDLDLFGASGVSEKIAQDYQALSQRLGDPVLLPPLKDHDLWPFAARYLEAAGVSKKSNQQQQILFNKLLDATSEVKTSLRSESGSGVFAQRKVLAQWRKMATEIASRRP